MKGKGTMHAMQPAPATELNTHPNRLRLAAFLLLSGLTAQFAGAQATTVHDPAALKPPPGARVAIVEFEDMECPDCARANPLLKDAAAQYHIPWVRHDFPLPFHAWSFDAAVYARWFDTKSKKLGDDFRDAVFANQNLIDVAGETSPETPAGPTTAAAAAIHNFAEKFAQEHGLALPFVEVVDRQRLYQIIDQALADTKGQAAPVHHGTGE